MKAHLELVDLQNAFNDWYREECHQSLNQRFEMSANKAHIYTFTLNVVL